MRSNAQTALLYPVGLALLFVAVLLAASCGQASPSGPTSSGIEQTESVIPTHVYYDPNRRDWIKEFRLPNGVVCYLARWSDDQALSCLPDPLHD